MSSSVLARQPPCSASCSGPSVSAATPCRTSSSAPGRPSRCASPKTWVIRATIQVSTGRSGEHPAVVAEVAEAALGQAGARGEVEQPVEVGHRLRPDASARGQQARGDRDDHHEADQAEEARADVRPAPGANTSSSDHHGHRHQQPRRRASGRPRRVRRRAGAAPPRRARRTRSRRPGRPTAAAPCSPAGRAPLITIATAVATANPTSA